MIDYSKLKTLREKTGVSFSLCKKALEESKNNIKDAQKKLNDWGAEKINEKSNRIVSQGAIFSYVHHNRKIATLVELLCETDFVANNPEFQKLGEELTMQLASIKAKTAEELLNQEYIRDSSKKISDLIKEAVLKFGENIKIEKIVRWELGKK